MMRAFCFVKQFRQHSLTRKIGGIAFVTLALASSPVFAAPDDPAAITKKANLAAAQERFDKALALYKQKLPGPALAEAREAFRLVPAFGSALIAARCLRELGRFDESLDTYAMVVRDFEDRLKKIRSNAATYHAVLAEIDALRKLVGNIEIEGAEIGAMVVVDLRARGDFPLLEALRVPAGPHLVRVYKEGYEPFEARLDVAGGTTARVRASLVKLKVTGTLQVVETNGKQLEVIVDGLSLGETGSDPWQAFVAPGEHTVLLRGAEDWGTLPQIVAVKANAVAPVRLSAERLTSKIDIQATPVTAELAIDGVRLGQGLWSGKLRPGKHHVEIGADGFVLQEQDIQLVDGKASRIELSLERDPLSPIWKDNRGRFFVEVTVGPTLVPTFGGNVAGCDVCTALPGLGLMALGRGGYRFPSGFVVGVDVGYMVVRQSIQQRETSVVPTGLRPNEGMVNDRLTLSAAMVGVSGGIRLEKVPISFRLGAGVLLGTMRDWRTGGFAASDGSAYGVVQGQTQGLTSLYVAPEVRWRVPLGKRLEFSAGLTGLVAISLVQPRWSRAESRVRASSDGQAVFDDDALSGRAWFGLQLGMGVRYEF